MHVTPLKTEYNQSNKQKILHDGELSDWAKSLFEVEEYLINQFRKRKIKWCYDCTACEPIYFKTLNYTLYCGGIAIHPLQPEISLKQSFDAIADRNSSYIDYSKALADRAKNKNIIKWKSANINFDTEDEFSIVILPGENTIRQYICIDKLRFIETSGEKVLYKPHPFTADETLKELEQIVGIDSDRILNKKVNVHDVICEASKVYTSHLSESCAYAVALGKPIDTIDVMGQRSMASFNHFNYHLFMSLDPQVTLNQLLSSPKSGFIDPKIDKNWKNKVDEYLDYILSIREKVKNAFIMKNPSY